MNTKRSGLQRADDIVQMFERYLFEIRVRGESLPLRPDGDVNLTKVAKDSGVRDRGRFYTNDRLRELLDGAKSAMPAQASKVVPIAIDGASDASQPSPPSSEAMRRLEQRSHRLEQQNAALIAENAELRRQLKDLRLQMGREDMLIETGRRILPAVPQT